MVDPGGIRCPNQAVHAPLSVILAKAGIIARPFAASPFSSMFAASLMTDSSNPERPRPA
jgi:hypothetical protein